MQLNSGLMMWQSNLRPLSIQHIADFVDGVAGWPKACFYAEVWTPVGFCEQRWSSSTNIVRRWGECGCVLPPGTSNPTWDPPGKAIAERTELPKAMALFQRQRTAAKSQPGSRCEMPVWPRSAVLGTNLAEAP